MYSVKDLWFFTIGVSPFGNLRVKAYFQLTAAYRRLSRPSSALGAKAFTLCSFSLEQLLLLLFSQDLLLAWASQIIVGLWTPKKDRAFLNSTDFHPSLSTQMAKLFFTLDIRKDLLISQLKNLLNTTICSFHSSLFGFQWAFTRSARPHSAASPLFERLTLFVFRLHPIGAVLPS